MQVVIGWDTVCELTVLELRNNYPINLHLILPCSVNEQTAKWNLHQQNVYKQILLMANSIEFTSDSYYPSCMKLRNKRLIELSDYCICYYDIKKSATGTGQTVRMAQQKGIEIINLIQ